MMRESKSDTACCTCNNCDLVLEFSHYSLPLFTSSKKNDIPVK
jgi:hypothetical protein